MLKLVLIPLLFIANTALAEDIDPTPEQCLARFATDYVPEHNLPNDYILSTDQKAVSGALEVIKSQDYADWVIGFADANLTNYTTAVGAVINYADEVSVIYASINIEGRKCQVKEIIDVNTVDIEKNSDPTLLSKFFLNIPFEQLPATVQEFVYADVKNSLAGSED